MANKRSTEWQGHDAILMKAMKSENDKAKPMRDALRLLMPMLMATGGAGAKEEPPKAKEKKR